MIIFCILVLITAFLIYDNTNLMISNVEYRNEKIPKSFDDFSICQISDLQGVEFGEDHENIIDKISSISPDIIVITGDLIDRRRYDLDTALEFAQKAMEIAPTYYVSGNHETDSNHYEEIINGLINIGVNVLEDDYTTITLNGESIKLIGAIDPSLYTGENGEIDTSYLEAYLSTHQESEDFQILLSHRPELFDIYVKYNMDLVLAGHAHGGQIRLPFLGGVYVPDQGFFPEFDSGLHEENGTSMYISRGLGNSTFPLRVFNRPEIVNIILKYEES